MKNITKSTTPAPEKDLAQTPWWFIESLEDLMGGRFTLDACALEQTKKARHYYNLEEGRDGLKEDWSELTWCNPPFSDILPWLQKAFQEARLGNTSCVIMPDNPETKYCQYAWNHADTIIRMPFRLQFLRPNGDKFTDANGKVQSPQFACQVAVFTALGSYAPTRCIYYDFRKGRDV